VTALITLLIIAGVIAVALYFPAWRRKFILRKPFPVEWLAIVKNRISFYEKLSTDEQTQLQEMIQLFLAGKKFYGCNGLQLNDDIRITIAAEACLLLLNRNTGIYPRLKHILVYPDAFQAKHSSYNPDGTVAQGTQGLLGESWHHGKIILSWDDVRHGAANIHDGHNVTLHEFSHQLDGEDGISDGTPILPKNAYQSWAKVLSHEYQELQDDMHNHHRSVMDYYGATNPAEFFAVATETFFEKPEQLQKKHPELFAELQKVYRVNPIDWQ
tara:strand:+ start:145911 stop:146720 length:810 start_codon:yes stop_codon:yes gene_type:complete